VEAFKFEVICICFDEDLDRFERAYIKSHDSIQNGYNIREGGQALQYWTEEMRRKQAVRARGRKASAETRKKLSIANKGKNLGRRHTEETRQKMSERWKTRQGVWTGKHLSEAHKEKISQSHKRMFKPVEKCTLEGEFLQKI
jgi:group I intron endonuclease